jgi:predicted nucleotidyltransferase
LVDSEIRDIVTRYVQALLGRGVNVDKAIIFGSYASGSFSEESDIDVAIVSPDFGKDRFEEGKMLFQAAWRVDPRIEPVPISSNSYEQDTWLPLIYEIRNKGQIIAA